MGVCLSDMFFPFTGLTVCHLSKKDVCNKPEVCTMKLKIEQWRNKIQKKPPYSSLKVLFLFCSSDHCWMWNPSLWSPISVLIGSQVCTFIYLFIHFCLTCLMGFWKQRQKKAAIKMGGCAEKHWIWAWLYYLVTFFFQFVFDKANFWLKTTNTKHWFIGKMRHSQMSAKGKHTINRLIFT